MAAALSSLRASPEEVMSLFVDHRRLDAFDLLALGDDAEAPARADAWLAANTDAHDALRRLVIEGRDGVRRALGAQKVDANAYKPTDCWPV